MTTSVVRPGVAVWRPAGAAAGLVVAIALFLAWKAGVKGFGAVPTALAVGAAATALFALPGYPLATVLLPDSMRTHLALFVLPVGACASALALTVLGFAQVPLGVSVPLVLAAGAAGCVAVRRGKAADLGRPRWDLLGAAGLALVVVAVGLLPMLRAGEGVLTGSNGDAVLASGVGEFLRHTQPLGTDRALYVDSMPDNWRSKYPIYYALAGVSWLSGQPVDQTLPPLIAVMLGFTALGFMLFAFHTLSAGYAGALLAMGLAGLDRILVYLTVGPFYNQMWGEFALAFMLGLALELVRRPQRRTAALFALFALLGAFAYPLMLPFPLALLGVGSFVAWRRAGSPRPPRPSLPRSTPARALLVLACVVAAPAVAVAGYGVGEKAWGALKVILPGSNLIPWNALPFYLPFHQFFGLTDPVGVAGPLAVVMIVVAFLGLRGQPREVAWSLGAMLAGALAFAVYFRVRDHGAFFYFKILGFTGPIVVVVAAATLARAAAVRRTQLLAVAGIAFLVVTAVAGTRYEVNQRAELFTPQVRELRDWSRALPAGDSILLAIPPNGVQLNATSMLADRPLSSPAALGSSTFPSVAPGLRGDWVLTEQRVPEAVRRLITGPPRFSNSTYRLYRGNPSARGSDNSTQRSFEYAPWGRAGVPIKR